MNKRNDQPLVSIVMPVYNAGRFVAESLDSITTQTYKNIEIICVDDGSEDDSFEVLERYSRNDRRMRLFQLKKNSGTSVAANYGIAHARGGYICRMDSDDHMLPDRLAKQVAFLRTHPDYVGVGGQCIRIDENGKYTGVKVFPTSHKEIRSMVFRASPIQHPTLLVNLTRLPSHFSWYAPDLRIGEDYDLYYRLLQYGKLANLPDYVILYREYPKNLTLSSPKKTFGYVWKTRWYAMTRHGYIPDIRSVVNVVLQTLLVALLPEQIIYPLHINTRTFFFNRS